MMWNYRVIEFRAEESDLVWRSIHEVFYNENGKPSAYSVEPAAVVSDKDDDFDLAGVMDMMRKALDEPVLHDTDFRSEEAR